MRWAHGAGPARQHHLARTLRRGVLLLLVVGIGSFFLTHPWDSVREISDPVEHFKYGSVGADDENGLPLRIIEVLPTVFADLLPAGAPSDLSAFGFIYEPGRRMPVGFSERVRIVPLIGMNCATCHTSVVRVSPDDRGYVEIAMGSTILDLQGFLSFLFAVVDDPRFSSETLIAAMNEVEPLSTIDTWLYTALIPTMRSRVKTQAEQLQQLFSDDHPRFGPGRVDTFNPYKLVQLAAHYPDGLTPEESIGTSRYPSIWNQQAKDGLAHNWDGNAISVQDRNVGAAFGAGATPKTLDLEVLTEVEAFISTLPAPRFPALASLDRDLVAEGEQVFAAMCADCHAPGGSQLGEVIALAEIGTDPHRHQSYTTKLNDLFNSFGDGEPWDLNDMRTTDGYAARLLDGIWARGPYLHNGSVPTLWDLLTPEDQRNGGQSSLWVGHGVIDLDHVGVRTDLTEFQGRAMFELDLTTAGNSNQGHSGPGYGTDLPEAQRRALIEYMKTL